MLNHWRKVPRALDLSRSSDLSSPRAPAYATRARCEYPATPSADTGAPSIALCRKILYPFAFYHADWTDKRHLTQEAYAQGWPAETMRIEKIIVASRDRDLLADVALDRSSIFDRLAVESTANKPNDPGADGLWFVTTWVPKPGAPLVMRQHLQICMHDLSSLRRSSPSGRCFAHCTVLGVFPGACYCAQREPRVPVHWLGPQFGQRWLGKP